MSHSCKAALVRCMDFRLEPAISEWLKEKGLTGDVDIISGAGAAKDVAQTEFSYIEDQIDLSHKLHATTQVILMNHTDCGGYGGRTAFAGRVEERAQHEGDLKAAKAKLAAKYPELNIVMMIADIMDDGSVKIGEVV